MAKNPKKAAFLKMVLKNAKKKDLGKKKPEEKGEKEDKKETEKEENDEDYKEEGMGKKWENLKKK